jgi:CheY-like chemotaxis protein
MQKPLALVVEDNPQLNRIISLTLQDQFEIVAITNGDDALAYLSHTRPDMILLDLHLPGASGETILTYVRSNEHLSNVRVILTTADAAKADDLATEADLVLLKPISPMQLQILASRIAGKDGGTL